ncbi:MAG: sodium:calcium antiporter [Candidatus Dormiibacterota bacterium]
MSALILLGALLLIVLASELFTNAVEWAGYRLRLGQGATGSLLAALGTALPETVVVVVALVGGAASSQRIAVGAVLGSSFLLVTLGAAVTGAAVLIRGGSRRLAVNPAQARRDLGVFLTAFPCAVASTLLSSSQRIVVGVLLLLLYAGYARATLSGSATEGEAPEPLHFVRWGRGAPSPWAVAAQLASGTLLLVVGSEIFVRALESAASGLGADPLVLAVIVVPFATELPETINSVLWVRSGDDSLALGNVAGAAAFQACILGFVGVSFTPWTLGTAGLLSAACTFAAGLYLLALLRGGRAHGGWLVGSAIPWVGYAVAELVTGGRLG